MNSTPVDRLLKEKFRSAKRGFFAWKKARQYFGAKTCDALIFQPDGYSDDAVYSLTTLSQLCLSEDLEYPCFVTTNPDMQEIIPVFSSAARIMVVSEGTARDMLNYALFSKLEDDCYVASLTEPFGRWGDVISRNGKIGPEQCFALGIYMIWNYAPCSVPDYHGNSAVVHTFLKRANDLQSKSVAFDAEAEHENN